MSEQMTTFDDAARKAAEAIDRAKNNAADEWFLIPITEMTEIITKHYADLAETFGLLCELAKWCDENIDYTDPDADYDKFKSIIDDPRIAALLAEKG